MCQDMKNYDKHTWKETARTLVRLVEMISVTYHPQSSYVIIQVVLNLVREAKEYLLGKDLPNAWDKFDNKKEKALLLLQEMESEEIPKVLIDEYRADVESSDSVGNLTNNRLMKHTRSSPSLSIDPSRERFHSAPEKSFVLNIKSSGHFSDHSGSGTPSPMIQRKNSDLFDISELDTPEPKIQSARLQNLLGNAEKKNMMVNNIMKVFQDLFPEPWQSLEKSQLEQAHNTILNILSGKFNSVSLAELGMNTPQKPSSSVSSDTVSALIRRSSLELPKSPKPPKDRTRQERASFSPTDLDKQLDSITSNLSSPYLKTSPAPAFSTSLEKVKEEKSITSTKSKKRKSIGPFFLRSTTAKKLMDMHNELTSNTPRSNLAKVLRDGIMKLVSELTTFVNDQCPLPAFQQISEKKDKEKKKHYVDEFRKNLIKSVRENKIQMSEITKNIKLTYESKDLPVMNQVVNRVSDLLNADPQGSIHETETSFLEGNYLPYVKKNLLECIHFKQHAVFYAASHLLSNLCSATSDDESANLFLLSLLQSFDHNIRSILDDVDTYAYFVSAELQGGDSSKMKRKDVKKKKKKKEENPNSIWKEENNLYDQNDSDSKYRAGNLNNLVIRVTDQTNDTELINTFLNSVTFITTPQELFDKLVERFNVPKNTPEQVAGFVRIRVINLMLKWVKRDFHLLDIDLVNQIQHFCEKSLQKEDKFKTPELIISLLNDEKRYYILENTKPIPKELYVYNTGVPTWEALIYYDETQIAEQLTIIELDIFRRIQPTELLGLRWSKKSYKSLTQNINFLIQRVNKLSYWVATCILLQQKVKDRAKVLTKMINIARALMDINNYNSLMGVLNGLSFYFISRLKGTWELLPEKVLKTYSTLEQIQNPTNGFKILRESIKNCGKAALPYLATYLADLTAMAENQDIVQRGELTLINFYKHWLVSGVIKNLLQYQKVPILTDASQKDPTYTFLYELCGLEENDLFMLSLEREPKGVTLRELLEKEKE
eukprot:TRINITY_DN3030_c1_g2_i1.p1 TRINITY_DN3030_c1_g2~~TRINITY_DN3030_c1_g2_i1.p1  ORF type:complete len:1162 (-),score=282.43 TRINITY_DN3030_c1_g2_i1:115-3111(-)